MALLLADYVLDGPYLYRDALVELRRHNTKCAVYAIQTPDGAHTYVGSSGNVNSRFAQHCSELKLQKHPKKVFQDAHNSGVELHYYFKLFPSEKIAQKVEDRILKSLWGQPGYLNVAVDSLKPWIRGEGYVHPFVGRTLSDETRQRISDTRKHIFSTGSAVGSFTGRTHTEESRAKISQSRQQLFADGYTFSEETRQKLSEKKSRGKHNLAKRCVVEGVEYDCMASAAEALGVKYTTLYQRINQRKPGYDLVVGP